MKAFTLVLDIVHIVISGAMLVLMPTAWADASFEEVCG